MAKALRGERMILATDIAALRKERILDRLFQAYSARKMQTELQAALDRARRSGHAVPGDPRWKRQLNLRGVSSATAAASDEAAAAGVALGSGARTSAPVDAGDRASRTSSAWRAGLASQPQQGASLIGPSTAAMQGGSSQAAPSSNKLMQELAHSDTSGAPFLATQLLRRGRSDPRFGDRPFSAPKARGGRRRSTAVDDVYDGRGDVPIERPSFRRRPQSAGPVGPMARVG